MRVWPILQSDQRLAALRGSAHATSAKFIADETEKWCGVIRAAGIKAE
jgi:hypothetical protein